MNVARFDVAVIGAGAAGMMCAATAGQRGRRVLLIDHYKELGEKIRISGGGRCNFTNLHATHRDFLSRNPDFCRSALARYTPRDFIALVEKHGIAYHEKTLGQLFCDDSSKQIIAMLEEECGAGGVEWRQPCAVRAVSNGATTVSHRDRDGAGAIDVARDRHRRAHGAQDRRHALRLPARRAVRPRGRAAEARARAAELRSGAARALRRARGRLRRSRSVAARAGASARRCSSRIAACRGRRSCRSRRIGSGPRHRSRST